jgi:hypothetical protein
MDDPKNCAIITRTIPLPTSHVCLILWDKLLFATVGVGGTGVPAGVGEWSSGISCLLVLPAMSSGTRSRDKVALSDGRRIPAFWRPVSVAVWCWEDAWISRSRSPAASPEPEGIGLECFESGEAIFWYITVLTGIFPSTLMYLGFRVSPAGENECYSGIKYPRLDFMSEILSNEGSLLRSCPRETDQLADNKAQIMNPWIGFGKSKPGETHPK